jgi:hypothetical protein
LYGVVPPLVLGLLAGVTPLDWLGTLGWAVDERGPKKAVPNHGVVGAGKSPQ